MIYFDSDMSNNTNTVVYFDGKDSNLYLRLQAMSHTIYAATFEQTITHQHVFLRRRKVSLIDGVSVTIILCLHVLIAHLLILDTLIIFSEYKCLKR